MATSVFKMGNLVMCSPVMFANNAQMVDKDSGMDNVTRADPPAVVGLV